MVRASASILGPDQDAKCFFADSTPMLLMKRSSLPRLLSAIVGIAAFSAVAPGAFAEGGAPAVGATDASGFEKRKVNFTFDLRLGYDDNVNTTATNRVESGFLNLQGGLSYTASSPRSTLTLGLGAGVVYYFDRGPNNRDYDYNFLFNLGWTYKISPRLTFGFSTYDVYQSQPDYTISGLNGRRSGDYFYSSSRFSFTYQFSRRFAMVTTYNPIFVVYADEPYAAQQNRSEHYLIQEFRFLLKPTVTLVGEYRFGSINYFDANLDSYANYFLFGLDTTLSPRLKAGFRLGGEIRDYRNSAYGSYAGPYAEGTLSYDFMRNSNISLLMRYGIEQTDVVGSANRNAFRIGLNVRHQLTARIGAYASFYYTRNEYEASRIPPTARGFGESVYDLAVGLRYAINRHWSVELGYLHTTVDSDLAGRGYDRNRVFAGGRLSF